MSHAPRVRTIAAKHAPRDQSPTRGRETLTTPRGCLETLCVAYADEPWKRIEARASRARSGLARIEQQNDRATRDHCTARNPQRDRHVVVAVLPILQGRIDRWTACLRIVHALLKLVSCANGFQLEVERDRAAQCPGGDC